jgi:hypothetical protein
MLENAKTRPESILVCMVCAEKEKTLNAKLAVKKGPSRAYLCTCKCPIHLEKCDVYMKWPGYNVGITREDLRFLGFRPSNIKRLNLRP